jgi:hypothetical protein
MPQPPYSQGKSTYKKYVNTECPKNALTHFFSHYSAEYKTEIVFGSKINQMSVFTKDEEFAVGEIGCNSFVSLLEEQRKNYKK